MGANADAEVSLQVVGRHAYLFKVWVCLREGQGYAGKASGATTAGEQHEEEGQQGRSSQKPCYY